MRCETCRGSEFPGMIRRVHLMPFGKRLFEFVQCPDCIGGVASCCDTAGANQAHILDAAEQVDAG
jgi:hypothetical protein